MKSNIGHLGAASGVAGVIKSTLASEKGIVPPNIWFKKLNPKGSRDWNLNFPTEAVPWPTKEFRRASINSFGFGESNCHCILDDAYNYLQLHNLEGRHLTIETLPSFPSQSCPNIENSSKTNPSTESVDSSQPKVLGWSAFDENGIGRTATGFSSFLRRRKETKANTSFMRDLAFTLSEKRTSFA